jgi:hypothetical protein
LKVSNLIKGSVKFLFRKSYRVKTIREIALRKKQDLYIKASLTSDAAKVILFIIDGADERTGEEQISGGIMSIASIYEETKKLKEVHAAETFICTHPHTNLLLHFTQFQSEAFILRLEQVLKHFRNANSFLIHVPEYIYPLFCSFITARDYKEFFTDKTLHVNILNQNIKLMPSAEFVRDSRGLFSKLTMTTAHEQYTTEELRSLYGIPLHKLSVYGGPERYEFLSYEQKEDLMIVSPDPHPLKEEILKKLTDEFPDLRIAIIKNIPYAEYLKLIRKAKWALTFGEGLDYYFLETVFSGGVSFAVYNEEFFTSAFKDLPSVYDTWDSLAATIVSDLQYFNAPSQFKSVNKMAFDVCASLYDQEQYRQNIKLFYEKKYTFA